MKIIEARRLYSTQIQNYREQQAILHKQKKELDEKMKVEKDGEVIYANEAATLELTIQAVEEKKAEYIAQLDAVNATLLPFQRVSKILLRTEDFERTPSMKIKRPSQTV